MVNRQQVAVGVVGVVDRLAAIIAADQLGGGVEAAADNGGLVVYLLCVGGHVTHAIIDVVICSRDCAGVNGCPQPVEGVVAVTNPRGLEGRGDEAAVDVVVSAAVVPPGQQPVPGTVTGGQGCFLLVAFMGYQRLVATLRRAGAVYDLAVEVAALLPGHQPTAVQGVDGG